MTIPLEILISTSLMMTDTRQDILKFQESTLRQIALAEDKRAEAASILESIPTFRKVESLFLSLPHDGIRDLLIVEVRAMWDSFEQLVKLIANAPQEESL